MSDAPVPPVSLAPLQALPTFPVIVFDGVCNMCNASAQFILDHDRKKAMRLAASQSDAGTALLARFHIETSGPDTMYFFDGERLHERSTAALLIARRLGFPWSLAYVFIVVPRFLRDGIYRFIAKNRYRWFGKRESCRMPAPGEAERFLT